MQQVIACQHCRTEVPPDAAHCPNCGQPMPRHLLPPGEIIGEDYQVVRLLGYGGMGEVYLAQHHLTGQQVAIKVLAMHLSEEVDLRIRFLDEARILARLDHPNIVMLHNFKQDRGRMLILMQYVDGLGLDHILAQDGPLHPERVALMFAPLCDALHHAHENGIIHRDLKPSNILVDKIGKARLTDFGIAKLTQGGANLTRTGTRVGTSWFMSPEQGLNQPADARSDIYALGVTLYNALAGRLPFGGASEYEVIKGHVERPPPPIYQSEHPFALAMEEIVSRALAKRPEDRFQDGVGMRDALLDALAAFGEENGVRSAAGTGLFSLHKERGGDSGPVPSPGARPQRTVVDEVLPLPTGELRVATPPLGGNARGGSEAGPEPRRPTPPMSGAVVGEPLSSAEPGSGPRKTEAPNLLTPPGRPAAPGKVSESTGILRDEPAGGAGAGPANAGASAAPPAAPHRTPVGLTSLPLEVPPASAAGAGGSPEAGGRAGGSGQAPEGSAVEEAPAVSPPRRTSTALRGERIIEDDEAADQRIATAEYPRPQADAQPPDPDPDPERELGAASAADPAAHGEPDPER